MTKEANYPVKTTKKSIEVIEFLATEGTTGVTEIAGELDMSKSVVHNHLSTLCEHGFVVRDGDEYRLGLKFLDLSGGIRSDMDIFRVSKSHVKELAVQTGESAILATEERGFCVHLYRVNGDKAVDPAIINTHTGLHEHMHNSALGKAILARLPRERVDDIVDQHGLTETTEDTITERDALLAELDDIREQGFALDDEERVNGLRAVAAPITDAQDQVLGSLCVAGPTNRLRGDRFRSELPHTILNATNIIELNMG